MAVLERLTFNAPAVSESFGSLPFQIPFFSLKREGQIWAKKNSTVNSFEAFAAVKTVGTDCITSKLTRMSTVRAHFRIRPKNMRLTSHCRA